MNHQITINVELLIATLVQSASMCSKAQTIYNMKGNVSESAALQR